MPGAADKTAIQWVSGAMTNINYSDATPDVNYTADRLGRQKTIIDGQGTRTFVYDPYLQLTNETVVGGIRGQTE